MYNIQFETCIRLFNFPKLFFDVSPSKKWYFPTQFLPRKFLHISKTILLQRPDSFFPTFPTFSQTERKTLRDNTNKNALPTPLAIDVRHEYGNGSSSTRHYFLPGGCSCSYSNIDSRLYTSGIKVLAVKVVLYVTQRWPRRRRRWALRCGDVSKMI